MEVKNNLKKTEIDKKAGFPIPVSSYKMILIGFGIVLIGFMLMMGGGSNNPDEFNCLFCYCPLYTLGKNCGGNFKYTDKGIKNCSDCLLPHNKNNYNYIMSKFQDIIKITKIND